MSGLLAGATLVSTEFRVEQSKWLYLSRRAGVTHASSLPSLGFVAGVSEGEALGLGDALADVGVQAALGVAALLAQITGRKSSFAEAWMRARVASSGVAGIDTTMLSEPWVLISASATPA